MPFSSRPLAAAAAVVLLGLTLTACSAPTHKPASAASSDAKASAAANDLAAGCIPQFASIGTVAKITAYLKAANPGGAALKTLDDDALKGNCDGALSEWQSLGLPAGTASPSPSSEAEGSGGAEDKSVSVSTTIHLTDTQGYTADLTVNESNGAVTPDVQSDPPGKTALNFSTSAQWSLSNTTPDRAFPFSVAGSTSQSGDPRFTLYAGWPSTATICQDYAAMMLAANSTATGYQSMSCSIPVAYAYVGADLAPNGSSALQTYRGDPLGGTGSGGSDGIDQFPEADEAALTDELSSPAFYYVSYFQWGQTGSRFNNSCPWDGNTSYDGPIIWTSAASCPDVYVIRKQS